jgi:4-amino-4-deoxy-L-arabinose transferase-like glycosyltransferase
MLLIAFTVRLAVMNHMQSFHISAEDDHFRFGFETGRIARSIASGEGFSSPLVMPTGATAWLPPVYPYLLAGIFKVFGIYTSASALCALILNSLFSALTCITIYLIGRKTLGMAVATWAAWGWAFSPYAVFWSIGWIWPISLSAFLFTTILLVTLELERYNTFMKWSALGLLWGVVALTDTALLVMLPFFVGWLIYRLVRQGLALSEGLTGFALAFALVLSPWLVRNYFIFGQWGLIRSNFGVELRVANYESSTGLSAGREIHPADNELEQDKLREMGELAYAGAKKREALDFIAAQPETFMWLTVKRVFYFWTGTPQLLQVFRLSGRFVAARYVLFTSISVLAFWGLFLAFRKRVSAAPLFAIPLVVFPLVYYITHSTPRYRHPIEPVMVLLVAYVMTTIFSRQSSGTSAAGRNPDVGFF